MNAKEFFKKYPEIMEHIKEQNEVMLKRFDGVYICGIIIGFDCEHDKCILAKTEYNVEWFTDYRTKTKKYRLKTPREALEYLNENQRYGRTFFEINAVLENAGQPYTGEYTGQWYLKEITNE